MNNDYTSYSQQQSGFFATLGWSRRKGALIIGTAVLLIVAAVMGVVVTSSQAVEQQSEPSAPSAQVSIISQVTPPTTLKVRQGQSVVWDNQDSQARILKLSVTADTSNEIETSIAPGEAYSYVFETRATYNFYDGNNPNRMSGVIIVE